MRIPAIPAIWRARATRAFGPWVQSVDEAVLRADAQAGLLGALIVLPQGIAFAALAGLPPAWGLYTSIVPCIVAALAGSSRLMVSGPTNATSLGLAAMLAPLAATTNPNYLLLAVGVTLGVGLMQAALGLLRMGVLTNFISPSVMLGFMTGAAALIALHAVEDIVGDWPERLVAIVTVGVALYARRWFSSGQHMLLALVAGGAVAALLNWQGWDTMQVGAVPRALPEFDAPPMSWDEIKRVAGISFALAIISLGQTVAIGKALAARHGEHFDPNRECLGQGLSNIAGSFFSCMVSTGSLNRTAMSEQAGARSPLAAVFSGLMVVGLLVLAAPVLKFIPMAAIAGLLLLVAWGLLDFGEWKRVLRMDQTEAAIAAGTLIATLTMSLEIAVLGGVVASLITYLYRSARPAMRSLGFDKSFTEDAHRPFVVIDANQPQPPPECPQLKLLRMEGSVYFGAVGHVAEHLHMLRTEDHPARRLMVMSKSMSSIDLAGADMWETELKRRREMGGDLYFHRPRPQVLALWEKSGFVDNIGRDHIFDSKRIAIATIVPQLDDAICAACTSRIFDECWHRPGAVPFRPVAPLAPGDPDADADDDNIGGALVGAWGPTLPKQNPID